MLKRILTVVYVMLVLGTASIARAETIIPQTALVPSTTYYTDLIGGGIGNPLIMTGGDSGANIGQSRNDDGFSGPINLGFTLNFFGNSYTQFWANNNGNISFGGGISAFTPEGPIGADQPVISPFFADVDTRNPASGLMTLRTDIPNQIIVTWDMVGYFGEHADKLNSFQLVLRGPGFTIPAGEGAIGFFYKTMQWETGDASGGTGGFGGIPAAVGFGNGAEDGQVLAGSSMDGISNVVSNHHIWFNVEQGGIPTPIPPPAVPEPAALFLLGSGLVALSVYDRKRKQG
ncbi:MAG TPA: nidogen-like domain-containing protein [Terriglobia bacterium]|nr:nidogen-like domain-containing protein [Terriglobia bacterium]